ncbi:MAG: response regulator [Candidatus Scalindua sp.]|jgi:two-component system, response regulator|nr:response regulator [Candidatus Scalindua sp.]MBT6225654.1 response regulator [Candidatus Scalindua sp.]
MREKILMLVEDNPDDVELTKLALKNEAVECELVIMNDGTEVLDHFSKLDNSTDIMPDVILLDLKMPRIGGLEVLKHLRSNDETRFIPVVILTSSDEEKDIIESYNLGANSYIRKPVNFEEFCETISVLGKYWLMLNEYALKLSG